MGASEARTRRAASSRSACALHQRGALRRVFLGGNRMVSVGLLRNKRRLGYMQSYSNIWKFGEHFENIVMVSYLDTRSLSIIRNLCSKWFHTWIHAVYLSFFDVLFIISYLDI